MNPPKQLTGFCSHCHGSLEYPAELIGPRARGPRCGQTTELLLATPEGEPTTSRKTVVWVVLGVFILALGLGLPLWGLHWAAQHKDRLSARGAPSLGTSPLIVEQSSDGTGIFVIGSLKNNSARRREGVRVEFNLFDSAGQKVGAGTYYQTALNPGESVQFKAPAEARNAATARLVSIKDNQPPLQ